MAVTFSYLTIRPMDKQFRLLSACDFAGFVNGFFLCIGSDSNSFVTFYFNAPFAIMGHNMYILFHVMLHSKLLNIHSRHY